MVDRGFIPAGISYDNGRMYVLHVKDADRRIREWVVTTYADEAAMKDDLDPRIRDGWFPAGFTPGAGRYWVLYQRGGWVPLAVEYVSCPIENEAIRRTVEEARGRGLYPVGIDSVRNTLSILFVKCRGTAPTNWRMGSFVLDAPGAAEDVNSQLRDGYAPFDILVAGQRVNIFYLQLPAAVAGAPSRTAGVSAPEGPDAGSRNRDPGEPVISWPQVGPSAPPAPMPRGAGAPRTGTLTTGPEVALPARQVPAGGRLDFVVSDPSHPLNGLRLEAPAGAYSRSRTWRVAAAPITASTFAGVRPVSPLVHVDNGGDISEELVRVRVPARVEPDEFAMGFYYDAAAGRLEGIPLVAADSSSVTVVTRHFSSFFVSAIKTAVLDRLVTTGELDSGFRPGLDDWQFPNIGSAIAPGGHCAGQSLTALWYYVTRPDGPGVRLTNRYDRNGVHPGTPGFWYDDNQPYRLASTVQKSINWSSWENKLMTASAGMNDALTFRAFAYSMHATGEPQEVGIFSDSGGHDMICYRIRDNVLYIADPNYPGNGDRRIVYDPARGRFTPYNSGANAEEIAAGRGVRYDTIQYAAKTATVDWRVMATEWRAMREGKAGNGRFPELPVICWGEDQREHTVTDSMVVDQNPLTISLRTPDGMQGGLKLFRDTEGIPNAPIRLKPGLNTIGVLSLLRVRNKWCYVDYRSVPILYNGLALEPARLEGESGVEYEFEAKLEDAPSGVTYRWSVDGAIQRGVTGPAPSMLFPREGRYVVGVEARGLRNEWLGSCSAVAVIAAPRRAPPAAGNLARLHATTRLHQLEIHGGEHLHHMSASGERFPAEERWDRALFSPTTRFYDDVELPITWSGTRFSGRRHWSAGDDRYEVVVEGTVSADGSQFVGAAWTLKRFRLRDGSCTWEEQVAVTNVPPGRGFGTHTSCGGYWTPEQAAASVRVLQSVTRGARTTTYRRSDWSRGDRPSFIIDFR